jgi:hypothetical protein
VREPGKVPVATLGMHHPELQGMVQLQLVRLLKPGCVLCVWPDIKDLSTRRASLGREERGEHAEANDHDNPGVYRDSTEASNWTIAALTGVRCHTNYLTHLSRKNLHVCEWYFARCSWNTFAESRQDAAPGQRSHEIVQEDTC